MFVRYSIVELLIVVEVSAQREYTIATGAGASVLLYKVAG